MPATSNDPDDGDRVAKTADPATNVLPSDSAMVVGPSMAMKLTDVKLVVLGNCRTRGGLPSVSSSGPGPMLPKGMTCEGPPLGSAVRVAFIKVNAVDTGKSGGRSKLPVKFEILRAFTPAEPFADGVKTSNESTPTGTVNTKGHCCPVNH